MTKTDPPDQQIVTAADHRAVLVFSASVVKELDSDQVRLPPNYVGVRRVRPSSRVVRNKLRKKPTTEESTPVVYRITENGVERRMNKQEKKAMKLRVRQELAEARKKQKLDKANASLSPAKDESMIPKEKPQEDADEASTELLQEEISHAETVSKYHQLEVNTSALEEELADLRGDRDGVPPVMLAPSMAIQALQTGVLPCSDKVVALSCRVDDDLGQRWATALKASMKASEEIRAREDMRPMVYQLKPEVWTRLRPASLSDARETIGCSTASTEKQTCVTNKSGSHEGAIDSNGRIDGSTPPSRVWSYVPVRRRYEPYDSDTAYILAVLHQHTDLHISCGAKFGCDFLLYDGRRDRRHAFAGLRIVESTSSQLPLPSSYDMAGYVRCLNTAGKLALLATVQHDESGTRVAFVDVALEKILSNAQHTSRNAAKARREIGKNLAKNR